MLLLGSIDFSPCHKRKNLLAFSAGIDSTALFFLLLEANIDFDIAIVNYNSRDSSQAECDYAKELARIYTKNCYTLETTLPTQHIEETARNIRYEFFDSLMQEHSYDILLTAHQLNDQLEWFLMQVTKGAGSLELLGLKEHSYRKEYQLFKPLLTHSKEDLQNYLNDKNILYFVDESNDDESYKRNYFRHNFSNKLISKFQEGIVRSFHYLREDEEVLLQGSQIQSYKELTFIHAGHERAKLYYIDKDLKKRGYILSSKQREEILKEDSLVISNRFVIESSKSLCIMTPYVKTEMPKKFKELCRVHKVPLKIRPYLYQIDENLSHYLEHRRSITLG